MREVKGETDQCDGSTDVKQVQIVVFLTTFSISVSVLETFQIKILCNGGYASDNLRPQILKAHQYCCF